MWLDWLASESPEPTASASKHWGHSHTMPGLCCLNVGARKSELELFRFHSELLPDRAIASCYYFPKVKKQ